MDLPWRHLRCLVVDKKPVVGTILRMGGTTAGTTTGLIDCESSSGMHDGTMSKIGTLHVCVWFVLVFGFWFLAATVVGCVWVARRGALLPPFQFYLVYSFVAGASNQIINC